MTPQPEQLALGTPDRVQSCELECGDGFHRKHWRFVCADCGHVGTYRYYKSYATTDAQEHECAQAAASSVAPALEGSSTSETAPSGPPIVGNAGSPNPPEKVT